MTEDPTQFTYLVVDDDRIFRSTLVRALTQRGLNVLPAASPTEAIELARKFKPQRALVDLRMPEMNGMELLRELLEINEEMDVVILTGYGSITSAVDAVKSGALNYITKPADAEEILAAFEPEDHDPADATPSLARVEYEHIQRVLADCGGNISQAARVLGIHRRSLQRKLHKLPPFE